VFDPLTVALEIKYPWRGRKSEWFPNGYRSTFITIWHKDPCKDGSDDSCDWFGGKRKLNDREKALLHAIRNMEPILDNRPFYPEHEAHLRFQEVSRAKWEWLKRAGPRIHPRWHVWHWRIQIHPLQQFMRWAFDRCEVCRGRFRWNESVMSYQGGIAHMDCRGVRLAAPDKATRKE
jgi:hypothetical protein